MPKDKPIYTYHIVILDCNNKLHSSYEDGHSIAAALDRMIERYDLAGMIKEYKFCIYKEKFLKEKE